MKIKYICIFLILTSCISNTETENTDINKCNSNCCLVENDNRCDSLFDKDGLKNYYKCETKKIIETPTFLDSKYCYPFNESGLDFCCK